MPLFQYSYLTPQGKKRSGILDADSESDAKERLKKLKVLIISLTLYSEKTKKIKLTSSFVLSFTKELSQLLKAGLPLYEALLALEEKYRGHKEHLFLLDLCDRIKSGISLSSVLKSYILSFDQIYISMIQAGEESGVLEEVLSQLTRSLTRSQKLKKQVFSAMAYPLFLGAFCFVIIGALFLFLIPTMKDLFEGRELQTITKVILSLSLWMETYKFLVFGLLFLLIAFVFFTVRDQRVKNYFLKISLKVPFLKTLMMYGVLSRFCRALSLLLSNGISFLPALKLGRQVMLHPSYEEVMKEAEKKVIEGGQFSAQLKGSPLIPPLVVRMLALAETTGQSSLMLSNIAEIYEEELEKGLQQFSALLQPVMLLFLGLIVALVMLAVLLPLTDVSSFT